MKKSKILLKNISLQEFGGKHKNSNHVIKVVKDFVLDTKAELTSFKSRTYEIMKKGYANTEWFNKGKKDCGG